MKFLSYILYLLIFCERSLADKLCYASCTGVGADRQCIYEFSVDIFASETGYFNVEGCEGAQPILTMVGSISSTFAIIVI
jgi:hypothetical protein